jgi:integrase
VTRTQAEELIAKLRTDAREGRLQLPKGRKTALGFAVGADKYIEKLKKGEGRKKPKNIPQKEMHLRLHLKPFFKQQRLTGISEFTIGRYKMGRRQEGAAAATINRELATLGHMLHEAVIWKWIGAFPYKIEADEEGEGRIVVLSGEEADALIRAAVADHDPDCWLFVLFGLNTAMRHSEILKARFDQIDFARLRLHVPEAKAGQREQPITEELAEVLKGEREMRDDQDGWIFPTIRPGLAKQGHRTRMDLPFQRAVEGAGLDPVKVTPHVMRHTAITDLVQSGVDLPTIQKISGHKTPAMVLRYTHIHGKHIDRAVKAIGRGLPTPVDPENPGTITLELHRRRAAQRKRAVGDDDSGLKEKTFGMEARAGAVQFTVSNDLAIGGTVSRPIAFRIIPGPSVPPIERAQRLSDARFSRNSPSELSPPIRRAKSAEGGLTQ